MDEISKNFPEGLSYEIPFDMTTYISESIHEVYKTLFEALVLVVLVVLFILAELACNVDSGSGGAYFIDRYFRIHVDFRFLIEYPDIARIDPCDRYCGG